MPDENLTHGEFDDVTDNITTFPHPWRNHVVMRARRQRKTGNVIFVAEFRGAYGCSYIEFKNPVDAAEHAFSMLKFGCSVTWEHDPAKALHA
jgi:hypothetical protein